MSQAASITNGSAGAPPSAPEKPKSEKQLKYEAKKAKQAQQQQQQAAAGSGKVKEKKSKDAPESIASRYVEKTPPGQKKILEPLDDEFHKAYIPRVVESAWYDWWEKEGLLKPEFGKDGKVKEKGKFVVAIPPPNVTGLLHIGHALATALQDTLIRWHRMRGYTTLYVPGCDHAGISTQSVVENMLWRRERKTRHDLGRTKFVETAQEWKEEYHLKITGVLRRLGASLDWSREAFTMSPELSAAVKETFVLLHEEGYIYRANRLVNWCTRLNTALSNLEVDNKELEGRTLMDVPGYERKVEFGVLIHFKYPIEGSDATIEVATTRIETMLGDTGIAVHPEDPRYKDLVGKKAKHPIIDGRLLPIVADTYVEKDFGTGAVKITPAHDPNDFQLGTRHGLEFINIMNDDGTLNQNAGPYAGQRRFDARYTVVEELTKKDLFVEKKNNPMKVPLCSKSKDIIEPLVKPQWWMKMREMADAATKVVEDGDIKIKPENQQRIYLNWMKDINDWCLSRQLWWGHQVPAYFVKLEGEAVDDSNPDLYVVGRTEQEAHEKATAKFPNKKFTLEQDPDVLDTWFSSGLWPFSTLGWPQKTHDLEHLYPTSILETGWDILFFWVARMVMFGLKLTGKVPFSEVYCHSLVRDLEGRKMSKSLGNVIDPVDIFDGIGLQDLHAKLHMGNLDPKEVKNAEKFQKTAFPQGIPECGADALRFSLVNYTTGGGDINFDIKVMASHRRFCNKIYQATKFVLGKLPEDFVPRESSQPTGEESLPERWILHKLHDAAKSTNKHLEEREFSHATQTTHQYFYDHLCDVYIENSKTLLQSSDAATRTSALQTLYTALESGLTLLHPFMPFLTEELWQRLPRRPHDPTISITVAPYPEPDDKMRDATSEAAYELVLGCAAGIRSLLGEYGVKENAKALVRCFDEEGYKTVTAEFEAVKTLCGKSLGNLEILPLQSASENAAAAPPAGCVVSPVSKQAAVYVRMEDIEDPGREAGKVADKLKRAREYREGQVKIIKDMEGRGVGAGVREGEVERLRDLEVECRVLEECVGMFEGLKV